MRKDTLRASEGRNGSTEARPSGQKKSSWQPVKRRKYSWEMKVHQGELKGDSETTLAGDALRNVWEMSLNDWKVNGIALGHAL